MAAHAATHRAGLSGAATAGTTPRSPLDGWWSAHRRIALRLTLIVGLIAVFVAPPLPAQLVALAIGVALLGVPHGALDHRLGRDLLAPRLGRAWGVVFGLGYLALGALVVALWIAFPAATLAGFLLLSAVHFGLGDVRRDGAGPGMYALEVLARGALPIALPIVAHRAEVARVFDWLIGAQAATATPRLLDGVGDAALILAPALIAVAGRHAHRWLRDGATASRDVLLELAALAAILLLAPPLIGFLVYFCVWHSARHTLETIAQSMPARLDLGLVRFARAAAPLSLATLAFAGAAWFGLRAGGTAADPALVRVVFIGLAALTLPHMLLCAAHESGTRSEGQPLC
ncbi:MAG: Brp/Blh family beta-carotene 15,15'-dioxygenase [Acidobacteriota bacterium]